MEIEAITHRAIDSGCGERPYRSHLYPACLPCKKRKSRCRTRDSSGICMMCQAHGTDCIFPQAEHRYLQHRPVNSPPRRLAAKARRTYSISSQSGRTVQTPSPQVGRQSESFETQGSTAIGGPHTTTVTGGRDQEISYARILAPEDTPSNLRSIVAESGDNSSHIISPAVADDSEFLESYLSTIPDARRTNLIRTSVISNRLVRPVLFNTVPRRPLGVSANQSVPAAKCEIIEKYLEPFANDIVDL